MVLVSREKFARYYASSLSFKLKNHCIIIKFPIALKSSKVTSSNLVNNDNTTYMIQVRPT